MRTSACRGKDIKTQGLMKRSALFGTLLLIVLSSCNVEKKARRYDYLLANRPPRPAAESLPEDRPVPNEIENKPSIEESTEPIFTFENVNSNKQDKVVDVALSYLGVPYKYGGTNKRGMDCSGLIFTSYQTVGKQVPRTSRDLASKGRHISLRKVNPGDILCFSAKRTGRIDHVGMVTDVRGTLIKFVHSTSSRGVRVDNLDDKYWNARFVKAVSVN